MRRIACKDVSAMDRGSVLGVDIETTGLDQYNDEILSVSIVDGSGNVLFDRMFRPSIAKEWPYAQAVNGISPEDVKECPEIYGSLEEISDILSKGDVIVTYNGIHFDLPWLRSKGVSIPDVPVCDVMLDFAPIYGEWNYFRNDYYWQKLTTCAFHYNIDFRAHDSLEDVRATMACMYRVAEDQEATS